MFAFGLVVSITTTYAWYTINIMTNIDSLNIRVGVREDYYLKLYLLDKNGVEQYKPDGYTLEEMGYDRDTGLRDVSGMFESDWNNEKTDKATALPQFKRSYGASPSSPNRSTVATEGYLQTVYYLESNENCEIYLTPDSKVMANEEKNAETARVKGRSYEKLMQVTNAVRLSFYSEDGYIIANPGETEETYYGGVLDMNGDGYYDSVDGKEVLYGEYNTDAVTYNDKNGVETPLEESYRDTFHANHQAGITQVNVDRNDKELAIKKENSVKIDTLRYEEDDPLKDVVPICTLRKGEKKRLVLSVYVEGWDPYMTDAIESAAFNIDIGFLALIKPSI